MKRILLPLFISLFFTSCLKEIEEQPEKESVAINLAWHKSYPEDSIEKATIGLYWCLSMVGAKVLNSAVIPLKNSIFKVDINSIALNENAVSTLTVLHQKIKETEAYQQKKSIDLGRYISLLIGASEHYYAITNVPENLDEILSNYSLQTSKGYVNNSSVSFKHRVIEYSNQENTKQLFLSTEIDPENNKIVEYETMELMENGQIKFGIFDINGKRINAADDTHTNAGKPAKCMWCHESNINQLFSAQENFSGFLTSLQLNDTLIKFNNKLKNTQNSILSGVTFSNRQEHVQLELAYISFMQPSALRLSNEWDTSEFEVRNKLSSLQTHVHEEFPFLGDLYDRNKVESFAPFKSLPISSSIREKSNIEVNYID